MNLIILIKYDCPVTLKFESIPVNFFESINQLGIAIKIDSVLIRTFSLPIEPNSTASFYEITWLTPLQCLFNITQVVLACDFENQLTYPVKILSY